MVETKFVAKYNRILILEIIMVPLTPMEVLLKDLDKEQNIIFNE